MRSLNPSRRVCPFRTIFGSKLPFRSRGTANSTAPTSVSSRFGVVPMRGVPRAPPGRLMFDAPWMSGSVEQCWRLASDGVGDDRVELPGDVPLEAAHRFAAGLAVMDPALHVVAGGLVPTEPGQGDPVQGGVGLAVTAPVEAPPLAGAGGGLDGTDPAERGERALGVQSVGVVPGGDEQRGGSLWVSTPRTTSGPGPVASTGGWSARERRGMLVTGACLLIDSGATGSRRRAGGAVRTVLAPCAARPLSGHARRSGGSCTASSCWSTDQAAGIEKPVIARVRPAARRGTTDPHSHSPGGPRVPRPAPARGRPG